MIKFSIAYVLFNLSSTYSYACSYFVLGLGMSCELLYVPFYVFVSFNDFFVVDRFYRSCLVSIHGCDTRVDPYYLI